MIRGLGRFLKRLGKLLLWLLLILFVFIAILAGIAWFLVGTERGVQFAASQANQRVPGLELENISGTVLDGLDGDSVRFANDTVAVQAQGLDTEWRSDCLLDRRFCLDRLVIDTLDVETFASDTPKPEPTGEAIALPDIALPIDVEIREVLVKTLRFQPPGDAPVQEVHDISVSARTEGSQVHIDNLSAHYQAYSANIAGLVQLDGNYPIDLTVDAEAANLLDGQDVQLHANLGNSVKALQLDATVTGPAEISVSGELQPLEPTLPAKLIVKTPRAGWPLDTLAIARADDVVIGIDGTLDDYHVELATRVSGEQIPPSAITLEGQVNTERVLLPKLDIVTLGGFATGSAALSWGDQLTWLADLIAKDIDLSQQFPDVDGQLNALVQASGSVVDGSWTLEVPQVSVDGELRGFPLALSAKVEKGIDDTWLVESLQLDNGNNRLQANGRVSDQWDITANGHLPELQNFWPGLAGGVDIDLNVTGPLAEPSLRVDTGARVVKYNDLLLQGLSLKADVARAALEPSTLQLAIGQINVAGQQILNARVNLDGTRAEHTLALFADGPQATSIDLKAGGGLDERFNWNGALNAVDIEVPAHRIRLDKPTAIAWNNEIAKFSVDPHCWVTGDARLCLENKVLAEAQGSAVVSLAGYTLDRLNPFLPAESTLKGTVGADANIAWGEDQPGGFQADYTVRIADGGFVVTDDIGESIAFDYRALELAGSANPTKLDNHLTLTSTDLGDADIQVGLDPTGETKAIAGKVSLKGLDIAVLKAFLPDFDEISGVVTTEGTLSGSLSDPRFDGDIVLSNPVVRAPILPLPIDGGKITTSVKGKRAFIYGDITSNDGHVAVEGSANWQRSPWRADVELNGEKLAIQQDPIINSRLDPKIRISARPGEIRVTGNVDVPMADISIRDLPQGATTLSDDVVILEDQKPELKADSAAAGGAMALNVSVNVSLGDEVNLSGYGLEARLDGDFNVAIRSPNPPQLNGEIRVVKGTYKQYGQNLTVEDGQILFVGPIDRTRLNIDAVRVIDGEERVAGLRLEGPIADPEVTLFTNPADKSQEAILSYIVLGRDIEQTSDQESNLLASAALALTLKGSRGIADDVADKLGIRDFSLDARGRGDDTEVVVSGRVSDRVLLRYGRSVFDSQSTLYLRYDITKKLYLEAAQGVERAVDLFYSFSF